MSNFIILGRMRKGLFFLGSGHNQFDVETTAAQSVRDGRAAEAFVVQVVAGFSESTLLSADLDEAVTYEEQPVAASTPAKTPMFDRKKKSKF